MEGFKIRVTTEQESKEAQELFFELGYSWPSCEKYYNRIGNYTFITAYPDEMLLRMGWGGDTDKEITIPQLKDMVVLKRNCVNDKNVEDGTLHDLYQDSDGVVYFYNHNKNQWKRSHINNSDHYLALVKPIKKEVVMKEFLNPDQGYKLVCCEVGETPIPDNWIEIPEGAVRLTIDDSKTMTFWKNNLESMDVGQDKKWVSAINCEILTFSQYSEYDYDVLWSAHTQPEELPFVGDGPKNVVDSVIDIMCGKHREWFTNTVDAISKENHNHYFKDVSDIDSIDVYEVLLRFGVTDPCLQHIVKKALVAGGRGHKDFERDLKDIHDTSKRALEINNILH